jgi:hypothetical protein
MFVNINRYLTVIYLLSVIKYLSSDSVKHIFVGIIPTNNKSFYLLWG